MKESGVMRESKALLMEKRKQEEKQRQVDERTEMGKTAADLFIAASMRHPSSVIMQAIDVTKSCADRNVNPAFLKRQLQADRPQLQRIVEIANNVHTRQGDATKHIPYVNEESVYNIGTAVYSWAKEFFNLPPQTLEKINNYTPQETDPITVEEQRRNYARQILNDHAKQTMSTMRDAFLKQKPH